MIGKLQKMETSEEASEDLDNLLAKLQIDDVSQILIKGVAKQMVYAAMSEVQEEHRKPDVGSHLSEDWGNRKPDIGRHLSKAWSNQE